MRIEEFLLQEKGAIFRKWFDAVVDTYPPETARMLRKESNQFANPVGHNTRVAMDGLYDEFLKGSGAEQMNPLLDKIIRIRAIQDFSPSQAVAFIFLLKRTIREALQPEIDEGGLSLTDLMELELRIDDMALLAFNIYMECREKLYEVRLTEFKSQSYRLMQRAGLLNEWNELGPDSTHDKA